jgi:UDP-glucose 4-epimerase
MSNILVTGGLGFIGSHLVDRLVNDGHYVHIIDDMSTGSVSNRNRNIKSFIFDDIVKTYNTRNVYMFGDIDVIYHLGAESRIQPSLLNPFKTFETNVIGTVSMCDLARHYNCKIIYAGSCTAEEQFLNPYAFTKFKGEEICKMYNEVYNVKTAIARFFNVYGDRHYREGSHATVLGIFEKQYMDGKPLTITGDGKQERDFVHVDDIVDGLIAMGETDCDGETYEFGYGKSYSINEIASMFKTEVVHIEKPFGEMYSARADIFDAVKYLGWESKIKVEDYINEFIRNNQNVHTTK